ncbi:pre T-cell antigen receptor alpha isoform X5 [Symphalangus syndactylus]|uniref:pre T-cell antigen receptor alpha isoform X5 n=1 Tax=Symphalangus syndactylus TaxID=9590 RepID=UPI0030053725
MTGTWLLLLLALGCPALLTAGNGSALDAFTYGPSPATDGTWTNLAHLSLPSEELASWEPLVCHTRPGAEGHSRSTQPLQLSGPGHSTGDALQSAWPIPEDSFPSPWTTGEASTARTCPREPLRGTPGGALWLGVLRLLLFKLLLFDLLLTCSCLRDPAGPPPSPAATTRLRALGSHRLHLATETGRREATSSPRPQPRDRRWGDTPPGRKPGSPVWEEGSYLSSYPTCPAWAWCSRSALRTPSSSLGAFFAGDLPPPLQAGAA